MQRKSLGRGWRARKCSTPPTSDKLFAASDGNSTDGAAIPTECGQEAQTAAPAPPVTSDDASGDAGAHNSRGRVFMTFQVRLLCMRAYTSACPGHLNVSNEKHVCLHGRARKMLCRHYSDSTLFTCAAQERKPQQLKESGAKSYEEWVRHKKQKEKRLQDSLKVLSNGCMATVIAWYGMLCCWQWVDLNLKPA